MQRITIKTETGYAAPESAVRQQGKEWAGEAVQRLGLLEDMFFALQAQQEELAAKLEGLRSQGKKNSVQFRELFAQKLTGAQMLATFQVYGMQ